VRLAAKYDMALSPILTFFSDHYIRIYFRVEKGAKKAELARENLGFVLHDFISRERKVVSESPQITDDLGYSGPLWTGDLHDISFLSKIGSYHDLGTSKKIEKFLNLWSEEAQMPPYFYEANEIASLTKTQPKPLQSIIENLKDSGFLASRTHFSPNGFKTSAEIEDIIELMGNI
jgi:tRNA (guanine26-N2/guanine27-N2)-dimethyltransferase